MPENFNPTQKLIPIDRIENDIVFLKNGGLRKILMVSGINFELKSEIEQNTILGSFKELLNSLDFPIQFFIHSRKINIKKYLELLEKRLKEETNELLKIQIEDYIQFIDGFVEKNDIISKTFFVIVPYDPSAISSSSSPFDIFKIFQSKKNNQKEKDESLTSQKNIEQLNQRVDLVINSLIQIGLKVIPLDTDSLIELFYNLYNPKFVEKENLITY